MGRTLDALKQAKANGKPSAEVAPPPAEPELAVAGPAVEPVEEMPFIEVGGPGQILDASPSAAPKPTAKPWPTPPPSKRLFHWVPGDSEGRAQDVGPVTVAFQPLPVSPPPGPARERFARELVALHQPEDPLSEQYHAVFTELTGQFPAGEPRVLLFTTGASGSGKTTVLLNLAVAYARMDRGKVVVVEASIGPSVFATKLGLPGAPGWREVLTGAVPLHRALQETGQANLCALTAGTEGLAGKAAAAREGMRLVLHHLREYFDLVLVDGPSWDNGPGMAALASAADGVYLVVRHAETQTPEVEELLYRIPQRGGRLRGYVLTHP
jgi:Mrp family chromosome partitioning ATPase